VADRDLAATGAVWILAVVIAAVALLVDTRASAAFDAPKRLVALVGLASAAGCMLASARPRVRAFTGTQRVVLSALVLALVGTVVVTLVAPRRAIALDALRTLALFALALPLGASRALAARHRVRLMLAVFVGTAAVNALTSLLQGSGLQVFAVASITGRTDTGAFLGNEGHLAQVVALAMVVTIVLALVARTVRVRAATAGASALFLLTLLVNRNLTALVTVGVAVSGALLLARGRRALVPIALVVVALAMGVAAYTPLRGRMVEAVAAARAGDWDALTTYRLGPWAAALEMIRERPLTGFGPGTFGAEFTAHRLTAELRHHRRLVIPLLTSTFSEAHSEYLQGAAEGGLPAALGVMVAMGALLAGLASIAADPIDARHAEAMLLVTLLGAAAIASLTWFPFQRPGSAVPLLLAAGRGWRVLGASGRGEAA
jgi:O-antigen ligase